MTEFDGGYRLLFSHPAARRRTRSPGVHEVHPNQVTTWKREAQDGLKALFACKRGRRSPQDGADAEALYSQIGRLQVQVEWLKKKSGLSPPG